MVPFPPSDEGSSSYLPGSGSAITVSERLALSVRALGEAGEAWLAAMPGLLVDLEDDWLIAIGTVLEGVTPPMSPMVVTEDGTLAVLKVPIPPGIDGFTPFERQLAALQLAGGDPYAGLIRYDVPEAQRYGAGRAAAEPIGMALRGVSLPVPGFVGDRDVLLATMWR